MGKTNETKGKADKPKNRQKVTKSKKKVEVSARMIIEALNHMDSELEEEGFGHSLAKIRSYIKNYHGLSMPKYRQEMIKEIMRKEYEQERIVMTNWDDDINFTKRFQATIEDDEIPDDVPSTQATTEEDEE